ncbi:MAG: EamA family transporter [Candidatus Tectomicrobia bacterium]|uniref:EamA family transporter n=1 Tax=Tectimicrobiota bacterium TaxID=2528274 RepID=A0A932GP97_UNCTE|nr:EamA family transporter [Candidatus Tectomicrobia bacterium]
MPVSALGLLVVAAFLHAGWNTLVKESGDKITFAWLALVVSSLVGLPLLASGPIPPRTWPYAVLSGVAEALYYLALTRAYERGDLSWVYPLARGAAPPLLTLWGVFFLGETPTGLGLAGVAVVAAGIWTLGGGNLRRAGHEGILEKEGAGLWAMLAGLMISVYSAVDKAALAVAPVLVYLELIFALTALFLSPVILFGPRRKALPAVVAGSWRSILLVGVANLVTYLLVLAAFRLAPVSYAGSVRELSVVIAAILGWKWLGEPGGQRRVASALLIFAGIALITWKG